MLLICGKRQACDDQKSKEVEEMEEERKAVCKFVTKWLSPDLCVELMEGLRYV